MLTFLRTAWLSKEWAPANPSHETTADVGIRRHLFSQAAVEIHGHHQGGGGH